MKIITFCEDLTLEQIAERKDIKLTEKAREALEEIIKAGDAENFARCVSATNVDDGEYGFGLTDYRLNELLEKASTHDYCNNCYQSEYNGILMITETEEIDIDEIKCRYDRYDTEYDILDSILQNEKEDDFNAYIDEIWADGVPVGNMSEAILTF